MQLSSVTNTGRRAYFVCVLAALSCVSILANAQSMTAPEIEARIEQLTGLSPDEIDRIYAAEQAPRIVMISYDVLIPVVTEPRIAYLLIRIASTGEWLRMYVDLAEWNSDFKPYLESVGIEIHRQSVETIDNVTPAAEAAEFNAGGESGETNRNRVFYGVSAPPNDPGPASASETDTVGTTAGNFRVNESGAATYTIPIAAAAGTAGVAPQISLTYSSNAGNGIAGVGWSIGGMSSIGRCRQTFDQDRNVEPITWTSGDRFCLDGQRLLVNSGSYGALSSTYRTEIASGVIVTIEAVDSGDGEPTYFSARREDGSTSYYGGSPESSATDARLQNSAGATLTWSLKHFEDSVGNPIWFEYDTSGSAQRIAEITYAFGGSAGPSAGYGARIEFEYDSQSREDVISGYVAGHLFENPWRLSAIKSYNSINGEALIREYKLAYNEYIVAGFDNLSRLTSIEECVGSACLPKTTFGWRVPETNTSLDTTSFSMGGSNHSMFRPADINGDGQMDLVWLEGHSSSRMLRHALSTPTGYMLQDFSTGNSSLGVSTIAQDPSLEILDYNLDGRQDVAYYDTAAGEWTVLVAEPFGDGEWRLNATKHGTAISSIEAIFVDVDSNGTTDAVYRSDILDLTRQPSSQLRLRRLEVNESLPESSPVRYEFGTEIWIGGSGTDETIGDFVGSAADFNGDGRVDITMSGSQEQCNYDGVNCVTVWNHRTLTIHDSGGTSVSVSDYERIYSVYTPLAQQIQTIDVNSDGLTDVFRPIGNSSAPDPSGYVLQLNDGGGDFTIIHTISGDGITEESARPFFADWNLDGYPDLLWKKASAGGLLRIRYWDPETSTLGPIYTATSAVSGASEEIVTAFDVNGDAVPEMIKINPGGTLGTILIGVRKSGLANANVAINRIEQITNGLGANTNVVYEPLSYTGHYDRLEVDSSPGTQTVCENLGRPDEEICWQEDVQVANKDGFYSAINGDWDLPEGAQTLGKSPQMPVIEMSGPMYVVTNVIGDAPAAGASPGNIDQNAASSISYYYSEAKIQAAGRGFLGFQRLRTVDNQSGVQTTTRYRQDWPFIGNPIFTEVKSASGYLLSRNSTEWIAADSQEATPTSAPSGTAALGHLQVLESYSAEQTYVLTANGEAQGDLLSTVSTESSYDVEGNLKQIEVRSLDGGDTLVKTVATTNTYYSTANLPLLEARLQQTVVTSTYGGNSTQRTSAFSYYESGSLRGLLETEAIEPGTAFEMETTHSYDSFGNRVRSSVEAGSETRCNVVTAQFDSSGRYVDVGFDCLGRKLTQVTVRNDFGSPERIRNYVGTGSYDFTVTRVAYSALGREYYRYSPDGSSTTKYLTDESSDLSNCPAGTRYKMISIGASGSESQECFDKLGRTVRTLSRGFDGLWDAKDTEYDKFGRVHHSSEPYDTGGSKYWTTIGYDLLGRVAATTLPDGSGSTVEYERDATGTGTYGLKTITTNDLGHTRAEIRDAAGEVVRVIDNEGIASLTTDEKGTTTYAYDPQGNLRQTVDDAGNVTTISYDILGRKEWLDDPDKGVWNYDYNNFGELTIQTDAKNQTQTMTYDSLGRLKTRVDKDNTGSTTGSATWHYDSAAFGLGQLASVDGSVSGYHRATTYDSLGRPSEVTTTIDGETYYEKSTYDSLGRKRQVFDAAGDGSFTDFGVVHEYNAYGYLKSIGDVNQHGGQPRTVYREVVSMNARGQVVHEYRGIDNTASTPEASVSTHFNYDSETGRLVAIDSTNAQGQDVQELDYTWDTLGNLTSRQELSGSKNLSESFTYDGLNRLSTQSVAGQATVTLTYDAIGNISSKSDVGSYSYGSNAGPHAVTSAGGVSYGYDANGNNTSGDGRTISYATFDKPLTLTKGGHTTSFAYGPERNRYRRIDNGTAGQTTTHYVGNVEIIVRPNGEEERKRYIAGVAVETVYFGTNTIEDFRETQYLHKDHLGSLDVITDATGAIVQELSFDAWGQRRNATDWSTLTSPQLTAFDHSRTTRGFTGHEMLDEVGVVHMNGRIYDPKLGRFLQADPFVQDPLNTQSLNRYSYVWNNPLNATDPSGYFVSLLVGAILVAKGVTNVAIVAAWMAAAAATETLIAGGNFVDALLSGISAAAFAGLGAQFQGAFELGWPTVGEVIAFGAIGGITTAVQGGKFGHGFRSAGLGAILGGAVSKRSTFGASLTDTGRDIARVVVGGTLSEVSGGKYANGAAFAAFQVAAESLGPTGNGKRTSGTSQDEGTIPHISEADDADGILTLLNDKYFIQTFRTTTSEITRKMGMFAAYPDTIHSRQAPASRLPTGGIVRKDLFGDGYHTGEISQWVASGREANPSRWRRLLGLGDMAGRPYAITDAAAVIVVIPNDSRFMPDFASTRANHSLSYPVFQYHLGQLYVTQGKIGPYRVDDP